MKNFFENTLLITVLASVVISLYSVPAQSSERMERAHFEELMDSNTPVCIVYSETNEPIDVNEAFVDQLTWGGDCDNGKVVKVYTDNIPEKK